jgi:hypothetical protein
VGDDAAVKGDDRRDGTESIPNLVAAAVDSLTEARTVVEQLCLSW